MAGNAARGFYSRCEIDALPVCRVQFVLLESLENEFLQFLLDCFSVGIGTLGESLIHERPKNRTEFRSAKSCEERGSEDILTSVLVAS